MSKARDTVETLRTVLVDGDVTNANFTGADLEVSKGGTGASSTGAARTALGVAIGTDVLAPNGSAANLTNLPASGAADFVASGTLPNGKPVILNANGTVTVVGEGTAAKTENLTSGTATTFNSGNTPLISIAFDINTTGKFVIAYRDYDQGSYGKTIVGTVSGSSLSFGSEVTFNSSMTVALSIKADPFNANKYIIAYKKENDSNYGGAIVGTVSGSSISFGSNNRISTANATDIDVAFDPNTQNKIVVTMRDNADSDDGKAYVGTVSGNSISFGSQNVFSTSAVYYTNIEFDKKTSGKFIVTWRDSGNSSYGKIVVGTMSTNSCTFGTEVTFHSGTSYYPDVSFDPTTAGKFALAWTDYSDNGYGKVKVGLMSANSVSFLGTTVAFHSGVGISLGSVDFCPNNVNKCLLTYKGANDNGEVVVGTVTGNSISLGTPVVYVTGTVNSQVLAFDPKDSGKFVISYRDNNVSTYGRAIAGQMGMPSVSNLTETNFLGTSTAAYTNGQTAKIMLQGGISTNQSSLAIGSTYYVQGDATLTTTAGSPSVEAGKAVSATTLLLKGI